MKQKILTFCIILLISNCADKTTQIDAMLNPLESRSLFGVDLSLSPDDDTFPRWDHDRILQRISEMNIRWVREAFMQYGIEYPHGVYHWEKYDEVIRRWQKYNFHILGMIFGSSDFEQPFYQTENFTGKDHEETTGIRNPGYKLVPRENDYGNAASTLEQWAQFVSEVVERYDGDGFKDMPGLKYPIKYWEGWNEPNYWSPKGGFWHKKWQDEYDTEDLHFLMRLHKIYYETVKKADPEAVVIGPSVLTRSSYKIDHRKEFYCYPEMQDYFDVVNYHRNHQYSWTDWDTSTNCVNEKPIWVTEFNRHTRPGETEYQNNIELIKLFIEAGYLTRYRLMRAYHYFKQAEENMYIDVTKPDYPLKELGVFVKVLFTKLDESVPIESRETNQYRMFQFEKDNKSIYAAWAKDSTAVVALPIQAEQAKVTSLAGEEKVIQRSKNQFQVEVKNEPIYIEEL